MDTDMIWLIGNIPALRQHAEIFSLLLDRPSPLLEHYPVTSALPKTLHEWTTAQHDDPDLLTTMAPTSILHSNDLALFHDPDFPSRIIVPAHLRTPLIRQHHSDLQHLSASKVTASLARHYFWPKMSADIRRCIADCEICENAKAKRRLAHGLFHGTTTDRPRSRYSMDFQGQGTADSGETEALAILDSFTKTAMVLCLPNRNAYTLAPALLDELYFRRGAPDLIHSDAAPEFLSHLMTAIHDALGTTRTTTLGHDPSSNGELESWWRYWNRCMRFLTPTQYQEWPVYAQRICFAYNSVPHAALDDISPYEMDFGIAPTSPFAPPVPPILPDARLTSTPPHALEFVAALRTTITAFHDFARTHLHYTQQTTADRLNSYGIPATFNIGDTVKIYMPPTHAQMLKTGRRAKHIIAWRGPCTISRVLSRSAYEMTENCSGRTFARTLCNIRPYMASRAAPPPHHDLLSLDPIIPNTVLAIRDSNDPNARFRLATALTLTETTLSVHYLGTTEPRLTHARFLPIWTQADDTITLQITRPSRHHSPWTGDIATEDIPDLLIASRLYLTATNKLRARSRHDLHHVQDELYVHQ
jgi:transposase InsO family protein